MTLELDIALLQGLLRVNRVDVPAVGPLTPPKADMLFGH
jgi:hypothetical protein